MTPDLQEYYEARLDLTSSKGWKDLLEDVQGMIENYNNLQSVNSIEELYVHRGQLDILNWIINLRDISIKAYEELQDEKNL